MNLARKIAAATVGLTVVAFLAGCAGPSEHSFKDGPPASASPSAALRPDMRPVRALKVIDPVTVVVTPYMETDSLYRKQFTVHVDDILTPAKGECGYDQALTLAKSTLPGHIWVLHYENDANGTTWIDSHGDHYGSLGSNRLDYGSVMEAAGMAVNNPADKFDLYSNQREQAQADGTGLWSTCPGFGK